MLVFIVLLHSVMNIALSCASRFIFHKLQLSFLFFDYYCVFRTLLLFIDFRYAYPLISGGALCCVSGFD